MTDIEQAEREMILIALDETNDKLRDLIEYVDKLKFNRTFNVNGNYVKEATKHSERVQHFIDQVKDRYND